MNLEDNIVNILEDCKASNIVKINISNIEYKHNAIVHNAGKYEAEIIIGAKINIVNGLKIPPVKYNNADN